MEEKEKKIVHVLLVNDMDREFVDKCGGKTVRIPPGKALRVPDYVAYHFIGDPRLLNHEDGIIASAEKKRISMRYAAFKPDMQDKIPKLHIEQLKDDEEYQVVEVKKRKKEEAEPEFPTLKEKG